MFALRLVAPPSQADRRLDRALATLTSATRSHVKRLIDAGCVQVAGERKKAGYQVYAEEEIDVLPLPQAPTIAVPQEIPLEVLCEDEYLAAINKPVGMVVHPAPGRWEGTVVNALLFRWGQTEVADTPRLGIVHRLDKETSGVLLVVAKDPRTQEQLARQFKERQIDKAYVAVVVGHFSAPAGEIALQLEEQGVERPRKRVR